MHQELWWDLPIPELLEHDANYHKCLDVVWSNDEARRWYFLHRSGSGVISGLRSDRASPSSLIAYTRVFAAATMARPNVKRPNQGPQVTF